jgi:hypothetical protein
MTRRDEMLDQGAIAYRDLGGGRELVVYSQIFNARLTIGPGPDPGTYEDAWDYGTEAEAVAACEAWNGQDDPPGRWIRNLNSARRRYYDDDGNVTREEVRR